MSTETSYNTETSISKCVIVAYIDRINNMSTEQKLQFSWNNFIVISGQDNNCKLGHFNNKTVREMGFENNCNATLAIEISMERHWSTYINCRVIIQSQEYHTLECVLNTSWKMYIKSYDPNNRLVTQLRLIYY